MIFPEKRQMLVISNPYLYRTIHAPSDRWSRLRRRLEDRFDRIGLPYVWPRVTRDRIEPRAVLVGGVLHAHPLIIDQLRLRKLPPA